MLQSAVDSHVAMCRGEGRVLECQGLERECESGAITLVHRARNSDSIRLIEVPERLSHTTGRIAKCTTQAGAASTNSPPIIRLRTVTARPQSPTMPLTRHDRRRRKTTLDEIATVLVRPWRPPKQLEQPDIEGPVADRLPAKTCQERQFR